MCKKCDFLLLVAGLYVFGAFVCRSAFVRVGCVTVCCSALQCVAVCCSVLLCVAVCYSVLQCVVVRI